MSQKTLNTIFGFLGTAMISVFVIGLAESISAGAAGFWGGLPFWIICIFVLLFVFYDFWNSCLRKNPSD